MRLSSSRLRLRAREREVHISEAQADRANPYLRYMHEMGENWK